jgi:hypothetical protein
VLFVAAKDDDMPRFLGRTRGADVPFPALLLSTILVQVMLVVTLFSEDAFNFALDLTSALTLIPFLLAAAYALKLALTRETYTEQPEGRSRELVVGALATIYTAFLLFAAGPKFILVSFIIYAPATILFVMARREQGRQLFSPAELAILAVSVVGAIVGVVALAAGPQDRPQRGRGRPDRRHPGLPGDAGAAPAGRVPHRWAGHLRPSRRLPLRLRRPGPRVDRGPRVPHAAAAQHPVHPRHDLLAVRRRDPEPAVLAGPARRDAADEGRLSVPPRLRRLDGVVG